MIKPLFNKEDRSVRLLWAVIILYFNNKVKPLYHPGQGRNMLVIALVFELIRIGITVFKDILGYEDLLSNGMIAVVFLGMVFLVTKFFQIKLKDIGLKRLSNWNKYEIVYLLLIAPLGFFIFYYFTKDRFVTSLNENGWELLFVTFIFYMCWGFYQEWIYRGFLQTELTRRYGGTTAILLSNVIFTLGPLHFSLIYQGRYMIVAATFLIGLLFGIIYHRSYNLWIIAILHGIGDWFLIGLP